MRLTRRSLLQSLTLVLAGCANGLGFGRQDKMAGGGLTFLATADWGMDGQHSQRDVARAMGEAGARYEAQFVAAVGDNFYDAGVASIDDPHWKNSFEDIYTAPALQRPWYAVLGNHDYGGSPEAQLGYAKTSDRWRMPARYFVQSMMAPDGAAVDLFFIDTAPFLESYRNSDKASLFRANIRSQDTDAQLRWLEAGLKKSTARWKLAFGHHPVFSGGVHGDTKELVALLEPMLRGHGVAAYISGHDHDLQHIERDGVTYIGTGAGAETRHVKQVEGTVFCSEEPGFTAYRVTASRLEIEFISHTGASLHKAVVAPAKVSA